MTDKPLYEFIDMEAYGVVPKDAYDELQQRLAEAERELTQELAEHSETVSRLAVARAAMKDADAYLADPDGAPLDSIRLARDALAAMDKPDG